MTVHKVLIAYATRCGSTAEVAQEVGKVFTAKGAQVDVLPIKQVKKLEEYDAVVIGSAVRIMKLLPETIRFAKRHRKNLVEKPTAYFTVGMAMAQDTPENRKMAESYLQPLCEIHKPVCLATFGGVFEIARLEQPWRFFMSRAKPDPNSKEAGMQEGDYRDWNVIRSWANAAADQLLMVSNSHEDPL